MHTISGALTAPPASGRRLIMSVCKLTSGPDFQFTTVKASFVDNLLILLQSNDLPTQHYAFVGLVNIVMKVPLSMSLIVRMSANGQ